MKKVGGMQEEVNEKEEKSKKEGKRNTGLEIIMLYTY